MTSLLVDMAINEYIGNRPPESVAIQEATKLMAEVTSYLADMFGGVDLGEVRFAMQVMDDPFGYRVGVGRSRTGDGFEFSFAVGNYRDGFTIDLSTTGTCCVCHGVTEMPFDTPYTLGKILCGDQACRDCAGSTPVSFVSWPPPGIDEL